MTKRFISEIQGCTRLSLGKTERMFLTFFCLAGDKAEKSHLTEPWFGHGLSAYKMFTELRGSDMSMTYKNVRKRIIRLLYLGLIEEIKEERRYRRAIKYKATSLGLFQRFLNQQEDPVSISVLETHKGSIILQTILFKYFEYETIKEFRRYHALSYVTNYLTRCCEVILERIESLQRKNYSELDGYLADSIIESLIQPEAISLVFRIVLLSSVIVKDADDPNITSLFPLSTLANDKKFMGFLNDMKNQLDIGYQNLMSPSTIPDRSTLLLTREKKLKKTKG